ncbi:MAG: ATP-dependent DNA helicase RecG [Candidatus Azotimanducaceae bacterium]|jgi:ATP-dependent DNA helicase RecG
MSAPSDSLETAPIDSLRGVGPALRDKLARVGIANLRDVLFHLPLRYEDRTRITPIGSIAPGETVVLEGEVIACDISFGKRRSLLAYLSDGTGKVALRFFHFNRQQQMGLKHAHIRCYGEVRRGAAGLEIYHPEYITDTNSPLAQHLTPVYPVTEGLSQSRIRSLVDQVLNLMDDGKLLKDIPLGKESLVAQDINQALHIIHRPPADIKLEALQDGTHPAQQRLAFEELLAHQTSMRLVREEMAQLQAFSFSPPAATCQALQESLAFELTAAQQRVLAEVAEDLGRGQPMLRLVQGDVGSGKTVVAALAAAQCLENQLQVAVMAPTELLAEQHYKNFSQWLVPLGVEVAWLAGKVKGKQRKAELAAIHSGQAGIVIGTHALFQKEVLFDRLGLVIIDEQHKFGVLQRLALREKGERQGRMPHQLVMTATPIPRTLTMSLYADMDCSVIDELPPGRTPVTTSVLPDTRRDEVVARVMSACEQGAQAYWVCTLIEESEVLECQAAEVTAETLTAQLGGLRVRLIHGRMSGDEKTQIMADFKQGHVDLLVATTVIEVGVDVPNASLMVIENPERLGLAQLHQLRGRIGRGISKSYCVLLYHPPLGVTSKQRLNVMRESSDGFYIAEQDLKIRGPGEMFGQRQSGSLQFRIADLVRDQHMLDAVSRTSRSLLASDRAAALTIMHRWLTMPETFSQV